MKRIYFITGCLLALLVASSCNKELSDDFSRYTDSPLNDTAWARLFASTTSVNILFDDLASTAIIDSFNVERGASLSYGDSMQLEIKPNSCVLPGATSALQGAARLEIIPLKKKGDFIKFLKPNTTLDGSTLITGGGLFVRVIKDGKELSLAQGSTLTIRFSDPETAKPNMQAFYGKETSPLPLKGIDTGFSWLRDTDTTWLNTWSKTVGAGAQVTTYSGYEINAKNLRWISAARYNDTAFVPKTKMTVILPVNFTNKNTAVFLVYDKQKTVVGMRADYASRSFSASNIPLGIPAKILSLSKIGNDFYLGIENISSIANVTRYTVKPDKKSGLKEIIEYLNKL